MDGIRDVREAALLFLAGASTRTDIRGSLRAARTWFQAGRADLEAERQRLLGDLLTDASSYVPYWRDLFARLGVKASDFRSVDDLRALPTMDKATVRANEADMTRSPVISRTAEIGSSGSTGEYATFLDTPADVLWERVNNLLAAEQAGFRTGDPALLFGVSVPRTPLKRLKDLATRAKYIYAFDGSDAAMSRAAAIARSSGARMVAGYASSVFLLANFVRRQEPRLRFPELRGCMTWGETLYPSWRTTIEEVLGVPVINTYGAAGETGVWAFQCRERDLFHTCDWSCIVEIEKDGRPAKAGEIGEILITALYKRARPLIRYRIGDLATATDRQCRCGRQTHTMGDVLGRVTDIVTTRSGMHISFAVFVGFIEFAPGIAAFQIVQNDVDSLDIFIVKSQRFTDAEMRGILDKIRSGCRGELALRVHYVSEIPRTSSGKRRQVISKVGFSGHGEVLHV